MTPVEMEIIPGILSSDRVWVAYTRPTAPDCLFYGIANTVYGEWHGVEGEVICWMPIKRVRMGAGIRHF